MLLLIFIASLAGSLWLVMLNDATESNQPIEKMEIPTVASEDLSRPFVLRSAFGVERWRTDGWFLDGDRGELVVDYFGSNGLVPDRRGSLRSIPFEEGAKVSTEMFFRNFPHLLRDFPLDFLHRIFGSGHFEPRYIGKTLTVPLFWALGHHRNRVRTDMHCEPIANVALQLRGRKKWTLVDPRHSSLLQPTLSPDGRAYFYAGGNYSLDEERNFTYEVITGPGDILYIPTFWWHQVDYLPNSTSIAASLFHFRLKQIMSTHHNRLYFTLLLPNIFKELVGWKTQ